MRPKVVCLCGSTRFHDEFQRQNYIETMAGNIVVTVGFYPHAMANKIPQPTVAEKLKLDLLHFHKIDIAERVYFINKAGYMGESTTRELAYSVFSHKELEWFDRQAGEQWMIRERHMLGEMIAALADGLPHLNGLDGARTRANRLSTWERMVETWGNHQARREAERTAER